MASIDGIDQRYPDLRLIKCIETLREPAKRAKLSLIDTLQKSQKRFNNEVTKLESEKEKTFLLNKLDKILIDLEILTNLVEEDIIKFALTTQDKVMKLAANPRIPKMVRMKARVASRKPLSTHLARVKQRLNEPVDSNAEEEITEQGSNILDKLSLNNQIVKMRKHIKQAKVRIIHKLTRSVGLMRKSKGSDEKKAKLERKAERLVKKIKYIKEVREDEVSRFALATTQDLNKLSTDINSPMRLQAMAIIVTHKIVAAPVAEFKSKFPNWQKTVPKILAKKKKKRKLNVETKEDQTSKALEPKLKSSRKVRDCEPLDSENEEGSSENEESGEEGGNEDIESSTEAGSRNRKSTEKVDGNEEISEEESIDNEDSVEEGRSDEEGSEDEEIEEEWNRRFITESSLQDSIENYQSDEDSNQSEGDVDSQKSHTNKLRIDNNRRISKEKEKVFQNNNIDKIPNHIENYSIHDIPNVSDEETSEKCKYATLNKRHKKTPDGNPKKIKLSSNIKVTKKLNAYKKDDSTLNLIKTSSKTKPFENAPKVVDPFFITSTNEEYVTSQVPSISQENAFEAKKTSMSSQFSKLKDINSRGFKRDDRKLNSFNRQPRPFQKPFQNNNFEWRPNNDVRRAAGINIFANRKERRKALHQPLQEEKVEKLHPSWEAKKKQTSIAAFQGKKMTFD